MVVAAERLREGGAAVKGLMTGFKFGIPKTGSGEKKGRKGLYDG
jgi:hypothetical protein